MSNSRLSLARPPAEEGGRRFALIGWFAENPVAANLLMVLFLVGGYIQATGLSSQLFPTIDPGIVTVTTPYPGATPAEVEEGITRRAEEAIIGIDGIERVASTAAENLGVVTAELKDGVDALKVRNDIETAIDRLAEFPPRDAEKPDIVVADTVSDVISFVVSSDEGEAALRRAAELFEQELLALPSVSLVSMLGTRDYEIAIEVSEETLRRYDLTISEVAAAIRRSSVNLSSGELRTAPARRRGNHPGWLRGCGSDQPVRRPAERLRSRAEVGSRRCHRHCRGSKGDGR